GVPSATPPACPAALPEALAGYADTAPSVMCPPCTCSPSVAAQCYLPHSLFSNANVCPGGAAAQPFDPPPNWDGTCTTMDARSSADSVSVLPGDLQPGNCAESSNMPTSISGGTRAKGCFNPHGGSGILPGSCGDPQQTCVLPKVDGYSTCIATPSDTACP